MCLLSFPCGFAVLVKETSIWFIDWNHTNEHPHVTLCIEKAQGRFDREKWFLTRMSSQYGQDPAVIAHQTELIGNQNLFGWKVLASEHSPIPQQLA